MKIRPIWLRHGLPTTPICPIDVDYYKSYTLLLTFVDDIRSYGTVEDSLFQHKYDDLEFHHVSILHWSIPSRIPYGNYI